MKSFHHPQCNDVLRAPIGVPPEECADLHIMRSTENGQPMVSSFWKPSEAEIDCLRRGGLALFSCWGYTHPPLMINTTPDPAVPLDPAGIPKIPATVMEKEAALIMNAVKICGERGLLPHGLRANVDAWLMAIEQVRTKVTT